MQREITAAGRHVVPAETPPSRKRRTCETMVLSRNGFCDPLRARVPVADATGFCIAVARGGDFELLPEPSLAAYVPAARVPHELRSGRHGYERGNRLLIVERDETDPDIFARLLVEGQKLRHTVEHVSSKRALNRGKES